MSGFPDEGVEQRVRDVSQLLHMHAGGIDLEHVDESGRVRLRFTGMCTGCPYRPVTMAATVRPALMEIEGVTAVEAAGSRISEKAESRLAEDLGGGWWNLPAFSGAPRPVAPDDSPQDPAPDRAPANPVE